METTVCLSDRYSEPMAVAVRATLEATPTADLQAMLPAMERRGGHGLELLREALATRLDAAPPLKSPAPPSSRSRNPAAKKRNNLSDLLVYFIH